MKRRKFINLSTASAASVALLGTRRTFASSNGPLVKQSGVIAGNKKLGSNTQWLRDAKWGVFSHYLVHMPSASVPEGMTGELWNRKVNSFEPHVLAQQLFDAGASYYFITIGQGGGYFCSPNAAYEHLLGPSGGKLSNRDLVADVAHELSKKNIRTCVYLPAFAKDNAQDQASWQAVIKEWSQRWGTAISAWWIDGLYTAPGQFKAFTDAFKEGNPNAIIAYNPGPVGMNRDQLMPATEYEDFLAGEVDYFLPTCGTRVFDGKQYYLGPDISGDQLHFLSFLGAWWGTGEPRFSADLIIAWTKHINAHGGTVTWDVPVSDKGHIADNYLQQLKALGNVKPVTLFSLLNEMCDPAALACWPVKGWRNLQASALNTDSRHNPGFFGNKAIGHFVRIEDKGQGKREWVLMEHFGPGAIVRMWAPNMAKDAVLRVYFDGDTEPGIEANMMDLFYGNGFIKPPFAELTARGGNVYLPVPFSRSCKVTVDKNICGWAEPPDLFYIIQYRAYSPHTAVQTFAMDDYTACKELLNTTGSKLSFAPAKPEALFDKNIKPGKAHEAILRKGNTALNYLSVRIKAKDMKAALRSTLLKVSFDGSETVNCPAGDFFGSGTGLNPFSDWMRYVQPDGTMCCRWIMPYKDTAVIKIENTGSQEVGVSLAVNYQLWNWDERSMYFHSNWRFTKDIPDLPVPNFNFLSVKGRGVYVGDTLNITSNSAKWWGEGPEKISVDGEAFPSQFGTGSEDYYGYAWGDTHIFQAPFHAQPKLPEGPGFTGTTVNTRIRSLDAVPFNTSFNFDLEVLTQGAMANEHYTLDYGAATYWYGIEDAAVNG